MNQGTIESKLGSFFLVRNLFWILLSDCYSAGESPHSSVESTVAWLEEVVKDSQAKCAALITDLGGSNSSIEHLTAVKQLTQKLQTMNTVLTQVMSQV